MATEIEMAVLIEAISIVIQPAAIHARYPGGWDSFRSDVPNQTLCADDEIVRVGFMSPEETFAYVADLQDCGLVYLRDGITQDLAIVDQQQGFATPCDWAEFRKVAMRGDRDRRVSACLRKGSTETRLVTPICWTYENSLSADFSFVPINLKTETH